jgi:hypothetical protein
LEQPTSKISDPQLIYDVKKMKVKKEGKDLKDIVISGVLKKYEMEDKIIDVLHQFNFVGNKIFVEGLDNNWMTWKENDNTSDFILSLQKYYSAEAVFMNLNYLDLETQITRSPSFYLYKFSPFNILHEEENFEGFTTETLCSQFNDDCFTYNDSVNSTYEIDPDYK